MDNKEKKDQMYRIGVTVIILLAVFTISEYLIGAIAVGWWAPILGIAILKAFFIVRDYMHISKLVSTEEEV